MALAQLSEETQSCPSMVRIPKPDKLMTAFLRSEAIIIDKTGANLDERRQHYETRLPYCTYKESVYTVLQSKLTQTSTMSYRQKKVDKKWHTPNTFSL